MVTAVQSLKRLRFGDWALNLGFLTKEQLDYVNSKKNISQQRIGHICVQEGFMDHEKLARIIAAQYSFEYVNLNAITEPELLHLVPVELMTRYQLIPYHKTKDRVFVAMADPQYFLKAADEVQTLLDMEVSIVIASETRIRELLKKIETSQSVLDTVSDDMRLPIVREIGEGRRRPEHREGHGRGEPHRQAGRLHDTGCHQQKGERHPYRDLGSGRDYPIPHRRPSAPGHGAA